MGMVSGNLLDNALADGQVDLWKTKTFTAAVAGAVTGQIIWTPATGKRICLFGGIFSNNSVANAFKLDCSDGAAVLAMQFGVQANEKDPFNGGGAPMWISVTPDGSLTIDTVAPGLFSITVWGLEV